MNDCITTTKQSTTKPCAYFLGYTVYIFVDFTEILHDYFIGTESVIRLYQCDRQEYGKYFTRVMTWQQQIEIKRCFFACVVFSSMLFMQVEKYFKKRLRIGSSSYMGGERFQLPFLNISAFLIFFDFFYEMCLLLCSPSIIMNIFCLRPYSTMETTTSNAFLINIYVLCALCL